MTLGFLFLFLLFSFFCMSLKHFVTDVFHSVCIFNDRENGTEEEIRKTFYCESLPSLKMSPSCPHEFLLQQFSAEDSCLRCYRMQTKLPSWEASRARKEQTAHGHVEMQVFSGRRGGSLCAPQVVVSALCRDGRGVGSHLCWRNWQTDLVLPAHSRSP